MAMNGVALYRAWKMEYFGYLPAKGRRRVVLLLLLFFVVCSLLCSQAAMLAIAFRLSVPITAAALAAEATLHHLVYIGAGQWRFLSLHAPRSASLTLADVVSRTFFPLSFHLVPVPSYRDTNLIGGPHVCAALLTSSLVASAGSSLMI